ncbi:MAG TPA: 6-bladed beta-propeller [Gemmatimonadales bacterium]|nr:6-bladed beta-propeller [Gemmatimonadales bacterium]
MTRNVAFLAAFWSAAPQAAGQTPDTVRMHLLWEVAEGKHQVADSLGELSGIALDSGGNVYVSDFSAMKLWVFDRNGRSLPGIGRKGRGPGEFEAPTGLGIGPDGRLYVRDLARVSRFAPDPATGRLTRYESAFRGPAMADWRSMLATRFDASGRLYYPGFNMVDRSRRTGWYFRYAATGALVDSLEVLAFPNAPSATAHVRLSATGGRMLRGLNHVPFAPLPTWDVTPRGTLITGDGQSYLIRETDRAGREVQRYRREVPPDRIPPRQRQDSVAALRARLDSVPVPLDRVEGMPPEVRSVRLPEMFPAYMAVYAATDGRVWVRRWPTGNSDRTIFDVFEPDGRLRSVVVLPRAIAVSPTPALSLAGVAAVGVDPETGANTVLRFAATPPG